MVQFGARWKIPIGQFIPESLTYLSPIQEASVAGPDVFGHQKSMERKLEVISGGQLLPSVWPHNLATRFKSSTTTMVPA